MSACGEAHNDKKTAIGNITATGAPVRWATRDAITIEAVATTPAKAQYTLGGKPGTSISKNAFGVCLFHIFSPLNWTFFRSESTNACDPSGRAPQESAAS